MRNFDHPQRRRRTRSLPIPEQLSLPLVWTESAYAAPSQSPEPSKAKRQPALQGPLAKRQAKRAQRVIARVPYESTNANENNCQRQRFSLTPAILTLITEANENRWTSGNGATLSSLLGGPLFEPRQGCAHVRRRSPRRLPHDPLGFHERRARLP